MLTIFGWNVEIWAVQKYVNIVDLFKNFVSNEYSLVKIGVDTAEIEPLKITDSADGENTELIVNILPKADLLVTS